MIKASVIVPVYNNSIGLRETLSGLVNQQFSEGKYQIIIVDNGSNDNTLEVAKRFKEDNPQQVKYYVEDKTQSSYAARNLGVQKAAGEILAFIDSDCIPDPNWLQEGVSAVSTNKVSMVAGRIKFTYKSNRVNLWEYLDSAGKLNQKAYVEEAGFGATANLFVKSECFNKYGLFLSSLQSGGDYEYGRRLTKAGERIVYCDKAVVLHPARSTFKSKLNKSKRVAIGQKELASRGLLEHATIGWRSFLPAIRIPQITGVTISLWKKIILLVVINFFKYYNKIIRLSMF